MMKKQVIFKKIGSIISEITEQYQYLSENPDNLNDLELELFIANSHFLSEHISILKKINESSPNIESYPQERKSLEETQKAIELQQETPREEVKEEIKEEEMVKTAEPVFSDWDFKPDSRQEEKQIDEPVFELETEEEAQLLIEPDFSIPELREDSSLELSEEEKPFILESKADMENREAEPKAETQPEEEFKPEPVEEPENKSSENFTTYTKEPEQFVKTDFAAKDEEKKIEKVPASPVPEEPARVKTLNDLLSGNAGQKTVGTQFRNSAGNDLKSMISLNNKLLFVKDLFNGYSLAYSEAIELVNRYDNFDDADKFLQQNYAIKNNWSDKPGTTEKLYEVLNLRFS
ncbi:MAG: hypothetical protein ABI390_11325 [Daejeonella sp.]